MGALDDAIKEHLELKRRHGASEDELRKQEAEALGPGRREPVAEPEDEELAGEPLGEAAEDIDLPLGEPPLEDEPAEEIEPEPAPPPSPVDPIDESEPDEVPREEPEPENGEDVLEETPEFLQETPEHDRLWFEQKPPRDFDFDE